MPPASRCGRPSSGRTAARRPMLRTRRAGDGRAEGRHGSAGRCRSMPAMPCRAWPMCARTRPGRLHVDAACAAAQGFLCDATDRRGRAAIRSRRWGWSTASGYVGPLLDLVPGAAERLPPLMGFTHVAGRVRAGLPCAGRAGGGGGDGCLGRHVRRRRRRERRRDVPERHQRNPRHRLGDGEADAGRDPVPALRGHAMHAAPTQTGGAALAWFARGAGADRPRSCRCWWPASSRRDRRCRCSCRTCRASGRRSGISGAARGVRPHRRSRAGAAEMARSVMEGVGVLGAAGRFEALQRQSAGRDGRGRPISAAAGRGRMCGARSAPMRWGCALRRSAVPDASGDLGRPFSRGVGN